MRPAVLLALVGASFAAPLLASSDAHAFCGFYVAPSDAPLYADASMVSLMREGNRTVLAMSNNYKGPAADFAMVVPVPIVLQKENVKTLKKETFDKLEKLSAPRLVEYWEQDPCRPPMPEEEKALGGGGAAPPGAFADKDEAYHVKVEAEFTVGEYEVVVLSAGESDGLERWLVDHGYKIPSGAAAALAPYVKDQQKFFVAKVDVKKVTTDAKGVAVLSPLRVQYESTDFRLPVRLGLLNSSGKQDLIVYVLAKDKRYEVSNYANVFVPTNVDVNDATRDAFGPFYAALFDATMAKAGGRAVVTEYSWQAGSCDPCPTPPLEDDDIATLGGDILYGMTSGAAGTEGDEKGGYYGGASVSVVLTRLHTRYDPKTLSEDLVFKAAEPVVGGREYLTDYKDPNSLEKGARPDSSNNFQARYAIRHPWPGPIACEHPQRGIWGGPPTGSTPPTSPATGLAAAPRESIKLASYVVKGLDDVAALDAVRVQAGAATPGPAVAPSASTPANAMAEIPPQTSNRACKCDVVGANGGTFGGAAAAGVALLGASIARRRRRGSR